MGYVSGPSLLQSTDGAPLSKRDPTGLIAIPGGGCAKGCGWRPSLPDPWTEVPWDLPSYFTPQDPRDSNSTEQGRCCWEACKDGEAFGRVYDCNGQAIICLCIGSQFLPPTDVLPSFWRQFEACVLLHEAHNLIIRRGPDGEWINPSGCQSACNEAEAYQIALQCVSTIYCGGGSRGEYCACRRRQAILEVEMKCRMEASALHCHRCSIGMDPENAALGALVDRANCQKKTQEFERTMPRCP
jgi:hypothetical protein